MICPHSETICAYPNCDTQGCRYEALGLTKSVECSDFNLFTSPPKPTMAEIERLVDAVEIVCIEYGAVRSFIPRIEKEKQYEMNGARAALLAAIRAYGEGK